MRDDAHGPGRKVLRLRPREACKGRERGGTCGQMQKFTAEKFHGVPCWFQLGTVSCRCTYHEHGLNPVDRGGASSDLVGFLQVPGNRATGGKVAGSEKAVGRDATAALLPNAKRIG